MQLRSEMLYSVFVASLVLAVGIIASQNLHGDTVDVSEDLVNGAAAKEIESTYNTEFPARTAFVSFWAAVNYSVFNEGRKGVVVGKDDWLFSREEYEWGTDADDNVQLNIDEVIRSVRILNEQGIETLVVLVPEKISVQSDEVITHSEHIDRRLAQQVKNQLEVANVIVHYPLEPMIDALSEGKAFLRTDTHWTPLGAKSVADSLAGAHDSWVGDSLTRVVNGKIVSDFEGDLMNFVPVEPYFTSFGPQNESFSQFDIEKESGESFDLFGSGDSVDTVLVGTSYSANALWQFHPLLEASLKRDVLNFAQEGRGPLVPMREYLADSDNLLDVSRVIWEFPVRYFVSDPESFSSQQSQSTSSASLQVNSEGEQG